MPEVIHFRESEAIIKQKDLEADVNITLRICRSDASRHPVQAGADHPGA